MEPERAATIDDVADGRFLHIPYDKRWDYLRPTIVRLYIDEREHITELAEFMKEEYSFPAK